MAKREARAGDIPSAQDLDSLIQAAGPAEPPPDLGNFPSSSDSPLLKGEEPERPKPAPAPEPAPEPVRTRPEPEQELEPEPEVPEPTEYDRRLDRLERENEFLRLGIQSRPAAPEPQPQQSTDVLRAIDDLLGGYTITPADVRVILEDPDRGAELLKRGVQVAVAAGAALALNQARTEFWQYQNTQQSATQLRDLFYGQHPDLAPYARLVKDHAVEVRAQNPNLPANVLVKETADRVRAELRTWGIDSKKAAAAAAAPAAPRPAPAVAEGGGGRRTNGATSLSPIEKEIFQLASL